MYATTSRIWATVRERVGMGGCGSMSQPVNDPTDRVFAKVGNEGAASVRVCAVVSTA